jgi:Right handed beta helix region
MDRIRATCSDSNTHIVGFTITGGRANFGGGIICTDESPNITNCLFVSNTGIQQGGGMQFENCNPKVTNCTVVGNDGPQGGGVYLHQAIPTFENTIIAFNAGDSVYRTAASSTANFVCSDIFGNSGGDWLTWLADQLGTAGNISMDPAFCDGFDPSAPYALSDVSPCAPDANPTCGLVGALPVVCATVQVDSATWGGIKARYVD